jgi:hypothetical protein
MLIAAIGLIYMETFFDQVTQTPNSHSGLYLTKDRRVLQDTASTTVWDDDGDQYHCFVLKPSEWPQ